MAGPPVFSCRFSRPLASSADCRAPTPGSEDDVLVQDYVLHEVLANEAPDVHGRPVGGGGGASEYNPSLAQALTDRPDAGEGLRTRRLAGCS